MSIPCHFNQLLDVLIQQDSLGPSPELMAGIHLAHLDYEGHFLFKYSDVRTHHKTTVIW